MNQTTQGALPPCGDDYNCDEREGSLGPTGAFEGFIASAIAAILTIIFSWRYLINSDDRPSRALEYQGGTFGTNSISEDATSTSRTESLLEDNSSTTGGTLSDISNIDRTENDFEPLVPRRAHSLLGRNVNLETGGNGTKADKEWDFVDDLSENVDEFWTNGHCTATGELLHERETYEKGLEAEIEPKGRDRNDDWVDVYEELGIEGVAPSTIHTSDASRAPSRLIKIETTGKNQFHSQQKAQFEPRPEYRADYDAEISGATPYQHSEMLASGLGARNIFNNAPYESQIGRNPLSKTPGDALDTRTGESFPSRTAPSRVNIPHDTNQTTLSQSEEEAKPKQTDAAKTINDAEERAKLTKSRTDSMDSIRQRCQEIIEKHTKIRENLMGSGSYHSFTTAETMSLSDGEGDHVDGTTISIIEGNNSSESSESSAAEKGAVYTPGGSVEPDYILGELMGEDSSDSEYCLVFKRVLDSITEENTEDIETSGDTDADVHDIPADDESGTMSDNTAREMVASGNQKRPSPVLEENSGASSNESQKRSQGTNESNETPYGHALQQMHQHPNQQQFGHSSHHPHSSTQRPFYQGTATPERTGSPASNSQLDKGEKQDTHLSKDTLDGARDVQETDEQGDMQRQLHKAILKRTQTYSLDSSDDQSQASLPAPSDSTESGEFPGKACSHLPLKVSEYPCEREEEQQQPQLPQHQSQELRLQPRSSFDHSDVDVASSDTGSIDVTLDYDHDKLQEAEKQRLYGGLVLTQRPATFGPYYDRSSEFTRKRFITVHHSQLNKDGSMNDQDQYQGVVSTVVHDQEESSDFTDGRSPHNISENISEERRSTFHVIPGDQSWGTSHPKTTDTSKDKKLIRAPLYLPADKASTSPPGQHVGDQGNKSFIVDRSIKEHGIDTNDYTDQPRISTHVRGRVQQMKSLREAALDAVNSPPSDLDFQNQFPGETDHDSLHGNHASFSQQHEQTQQFPKQLCHSSNQQIDQPSFIVYGGNQSNVDNAEGLNIQSYRSEKAWSQGDENSKVAWRRVGYSMTLPGDEDEGQLDGNYVLEHWEDNSSYTVDLHLEVENLSSEQETDSESRDRKRSGRNSQNGNGNGRGGKGGHLPRGGGGGGGGPSTSVTQRPLSVGGNGFNSNSPYSHNHCQNDYQRSAPTGKGNDQGIKKNFKDLNTLSRPSNMDIDPKSLAYQELEKLQDFSEANLDTMGDRKPITRGQMGSHAPNESDFSYNKQPHDGSSVTLPSLQAAQLQKSPINLNSNKKTDVGSGSIVRPINTSEQVIDFGDEQVHKGRNIIGSGENGSSFKSHLNEGTGLKGVTPTTSPEFNTTPLITDSNNKVVGEWGGGAGEYGTNITSYNNEGLTPINTPRPAQEGELDNSSRYIWGFDYDNSGIYTKSETGAGRKGDVEKQVHNRENEGVADLTKVDPYGQGKDLVDYPINTANLVTGKHGNLHYAASLIESSKGPKKNIHGHANDSTCGLNGSAPDLPFEIIKEGNTIKGGIGHAKGEGSSEPHFSVQSSSSPIEQHLNGKGNLLNHDISSTSIDNNKIDSSPIGTDTSHRGGQSVSGSGDRELSHAADKIRDSINERTEERDPGNRGMLGFTGFSDDPKSDTILVKNQSEYKQNNHGDLVTHDGQFLNSKDRHKACSHISRGESRADQSNIGENNKNSANIPTGIFYIPDNQQRAIIQQSNINNGTGKQYKQQGTRGSEEEISQGVDGNIQVHSHKVDAQNLSKSDSRMGNQQQGPVIDGHEIDLHGEDGSLYGFGPPSGHCSDANGSFQNQRHVYSHRDQYGKGESEGIKGRREMPDGRGGEDRGMCGPGLNNSYDSNEQVCYRNVPDYVNINQYPNRSEYFQYQSQHNHSESYDPPVHVKYAPIRNTSDIQGNYGMDHHSNNTQGQPIADSIDYRSTQYPLPPHKQLFTQQINDSGGGYNYSSPPSLPSEWGPGNQSIPPSHRMPISQNEADALNDTRQAWQSNLGPSGDAGGHLNKPAWRTPTDFLPTQEQRYPYSPPHHLPAERSRSPYSASSMDGGERGSRGATSPNSLHASAASSYQDDRYNDVRGYPARRTPSPRTCTAQATSTALARRDYYMGQNPGYTGHMIAQKDDYDSVVAATGNGEATGENPYIAVARATARAATIASASAAAGVSQLSPSYNAGQNGEDSSSEINVVISTSCTIKNDDHSPHFEDESRDVLTVMDSRRGQSPEYSTYEPLPGPSRPSLMRDESLEGPKRMMITIEQEGSQEKRSRTVECELPENPQDEDDLSRVISSAVKRILKTNKSRPQIQGSGGGGEKKLDDIIEKVTQQVIQAYSMESGANIGVGGQYKQSVIDKGVSQNIPSSPTKVVKGETVPKFRVPRIDKETYKEMHRIKRDDPDNLEKFAVPVNVYGHRMQYVSDLSRSRSRSTSPEKGRDRSTSQEKTVFYVTGTAPNGQSLCDQGQEGVVLKVSKDPKRHLRIENVSHSETESGSEAESAPLRGRKGRSQNGPREISSDSDGTRKIKGILRKPTHDTTRNQSPDVNIGRMQRPRPYQGIPEKPVVKGQFQNKPIEKKPYESVLLKPFKNTSTPLNVAKKYESVEKQMSDQRSKLDNARKGYLDIVPKNPPWPQGTILDAAFEEKKKRWMESSGRGDRGSFHLVNIDINQDPFRSRKEKSQSTEDLIKRLSSTRLKAPGCSHIDQRWQAIPKLKPYKSQGNLLDESCMGPSTSRLSGAQHPTTKEDLRRVQSLGTLPGQFFANKRSYTSLIETDLDTGLSTETPLIYETDLDSIIQQKARSLTNLSMKTSLVDIDIDEDRRKSLEHIPRNGANLMYSLPSEQGTDSGNLEGAKEKCMSAGELRIAQSLNKLSIPEWYRNSFGKGKKAIDLPHTRQFREGSGSDSLDSSFEFSRRDPLNSSFGSSRDGSHTPRPIVIQHRVATPRRSVSPNPLPPPPTQFQDREQKPFELPSSKLKSHHVDLKPMEIKPYQYPPAQVPEKNSAKEAYLRLKAQSHVQNNDLNKTKSDDTGVKSITSPQVKTLTTSALPSKKPRVYSSGQDSGIGYSPKLDENITYSPGNTVAELVKDMDLGDTANGSQSEKDMKSIMVPDAVYTKMMMSIETSRKEIRDRAHEISTDPSIPPGLLNRDENSLQTRECFPVLSYDESPNSKKKQASDREEKDESKVTLSLAKTAPKKPPRPNLPKQGKRGSPTLNQVVDSLIPLSPTGDSSSTASEEDNSRDTSPRRRVFRLLRSAQTPRNSMISVNTTRSQENLSEPDEVKVEHTYENVDPRVPSAKITEEDAIVRCRNPKCKKATKLAEARESYKTCHNCYTYYCGRDCRKAHWERHKQKCLFSRINSVCKHIVKKVHDTPKLLDDISKTARTGYMSKGRGCVLIAFSSPEKADSFLEEGNLEFDAPPGYANLEDLKGASDVFGEHYSEMMEICKSYNPEIKFVIEIAVVAGPEIPAWPVPRREGPVIKKCAKLRLSTAQPKPVSKAEQETLILTAIPGAEFTENMNEKKAREICFVNIQRKLRQRGVSLRHHFPDVYTKLCNYVAENANFTPMTIYPMDANTGKRFMCLIMPNSEPEVEWMHNPDLLDELGLATQV